MKRKISDLLKGYKKDTITVKDLENVFKRLCNFKIDSVYLLYLLNANLSVKEESWLNSLVEQLDDYIYMLSKDPDYIEVLKQVQRFPTSMNLYQLREIYEALGLVLNTKSLCKRLGWFELVSIKEEWGMGSMQELLAQAIFEDKKEQTSSSISEATILKMLIEYGDFIEYEELVEVYRKLDLKLDIAKLSKRLLWTPLKPHTVSSWGLFNNQAQTLAAAIWLDFQNQNSAKITKTTITKEEPMDKTIGSVKIQEKVTKVKLRKPANPEFIESNFGNLAGYFPLKRLEGGKIVYERLGEDPTDFTIDKMLEIFNKKIVGSIANTENQYKEIAVRIGIYQGVETTVEYLEV